MLFPAIADLRVDGDMLILILVVLAILVLLFWLIGNRPWR